MKEHENMDHNQPVMEFVDHLVDQWAHQFEHPPEFPFSFQIDREGRLCFDNKPLCSASEIDLNKYVVDVEEFGFYTNSGDCYTFRVDWPYNEPISDVQVLKKDNSLSTNK